MKSDIRPGWWWRNLMKTVILAAIAALSVAAAIVPAANAANFGRPHSTYHQGPYDNTGNGPKYNWGDGGGG